MLRVAANLVFEERLTGRINHTDEAFVEGLSVAADKMFGMWAEAESGDKVITAGEPEGAIFTMDGLTGPLQQLLQEGASGSINFRWHHILSDRGDG